jgi:hypothetical protein
MTPDGEGYTPFEAAELVIAHATDLPRELHAPCWMTPPSTRLAFALVALAHRLLDHIDLVTAEDLLEAADLVSTISRGLGELAWLGTTLTGIETLEPSSDPEIIATRTAAIDASRSRRDQAQTVLDRALQRLDEIATAAEERRRQEGELASYHTALLATGDPVETPAIDRLDSLTPPPSREGASSL